MLWLGIVFNRGIFRGRWPYTPVPRGSLILDEQKQTAYRP